jgi:hypothetical protein
MHIFKNNQAKFILQNLGLRYLPLIKALYGSIFKNLKHSVALNFLKNPMKILKTHRK